MEARNNLNPNRSPYSGANLTIICLIGIFIIFLFLSYNRLNHSDQIAYGLIILLIIAIAFTFVSNKIKNIKTKAIIQSLFVFGFFSFYYKFISDFQLILHNHWLDYKLISIDSYFFGSELSLLMQSIVTPYLTETMMFAYVFYLPLLLIVGLIAYKNGSEKGLSEYLFILSLGYSVCYVGFILFPVAGQMYYMSENYITELNGGIFTYLGELIRREAHFPGGNLPSPHCMAATIMLYILFKYNNNSFYLFLPVSLLLYISTVYGRYHYVWDGIIAIVLALIIIKLSPVFVKFNELLKLFMDSVMHPWCISDNLSD